jgi:hypothetical protein
MTTVSLPLPGDIVIHDFRPSENPIVNESLKVFQWNVERNYGKIKKKITMSL